MRVILFCCILFNLIGISEFSLAENVSRPPQFVVMAFDGAPDISRWESTRAFAKSLKAKNISLHFTYFLSSVYFLEATNKTFYKGPYHNPGQSDVGFGGTESEVLSRVAQANAASSPEESHEMASHLNGHFDGTHWLAKDWEDEFTVFYDLIFKVFENNRITNLPKIQWSFTPQSIVGFRAPYLAISVGLWEALKANHYRYDTSEVRPPTLWPDNKRGFWNFSLASLKIAGSGKSTLSMDYNFYVAQSGAKEDPAHSSLYEKQMYETYVHYFLDNYNGNRAPVHIGHHFPLMNAGAYWQAMQHFAETVCGLPEVRCVSYRELADFMDAQKPGDLASFRAGRFEKLPALEIKTDLQTIFPSHLEAVDEDVMMGDMPAAHDPELENRIEAGDRDGVQN